MILNSNPQNKNFTAKKWKQNIGFLNSYALNPMWEVLILTFDSAEQAHQRSFP